MVFPFPRESLGSRLRAALFLGAALLPALFARAEDARPSAANAQAAAARKLFAPDNLVAWCIVPFDAQRRGPEARADMLEKLKFRKFAYDYRAEHIPTFDAEMEALKKHHVELFAWWFPSELNEESRGILAVLERHKLKAQLWVTGGGGPTKNAEEQRQRVTSEAVRIRRIAEEAAKIGCTVGLYNHGGWFGEPENQLAIIEELKLPNVGLVYNQHHGHDHLQRFPELLQRMLPHLYALNLNGMMPDGERRGQKILPLGQGELDLALLKTICDSGYQGPIGILGHTQDDAEARLRDNLDGLAWLLPQLEGKPAGERPRPRTGVPAANSGAAKTPVATPGFLVAGRAEYRQRPLTFECRVKLSRKNEYNILVASDTKASSQHWELFTLPGSGTLSAYVPGYSPDHVNSSTLVADGQWHEVALQLEAGRVRLFVDGRAVAEKEIVARAAAPLDGDLAFGRLVEGGLGSAGEFAWARISAGLEPVRAPSDELPGATEKTLGLWKLNAPGAEISDATKAKNAAKRVGQP